MSTETNQLPKPNVATWSSFAKGLRQIGLSAFASSEVKITEEGAADLRVLGLMLLARTLSNFKGALIMIDNSCIVEARILSRCCYENQYWIMALNNDGEKFRGEMVQHEMKHKRMRMQTLFESRVGLDDQMEDRLRNWMRDNKKWSDAKTFDPKNVAKRGPDQSYVFYQHLSWDAHPSVETLNRYYVPPKSDGIPGIDVEPASKPEEVVETLNLLCLPVIGVLLGVSELLGYAETPAGIASAAAEYKRLTEETGGIKN
jgi:hypothetical protein